MKSFQNPREMKKEIKVSNVQEATEEIRGTTPEKVPVVALVLPELRQIVVVDRRQLIPSAKHVPVPPHLRTKEEIERFAKDFVNTVVEHEPCFVCGDLKFSEFSGKRITQEESDLVLPEAVGKWVCSLHCFKELVHLHFLIDHGRRLNRMEQAQVVMGAMLNHKKPN